MSKGLIINEDVWDLIEDLDSKETRSLIVSLSALVRGEDVPQMTRVVKAVYNRILLDNGRARSDISEIRRQAALKRWRKDKDIQNDAKVYANNAKDAKDANAFCITEEEKERSKEKEEYIKDSISSPSLSSSTKRSPLIPSSPLFDNKEVCDAWLEWVEMRKKIKRPMVGQAESRAVARLNNLSGGDPSEAVKILNQSTDKCWIGLFEVQRDWKGKGKDVFDEWARA